jgi:hypothetical protein
MAKPKLTPRTIPTTTLTITIQNEVDYMEAGPPSAFAMQSGVPPLTPPDNFPLVTLIGDITAVNGDPVEGLFVGRTASVRATAPNPPPPPSPGWAIADFDRTALREAVFEIRQYGAKGPAGPAGPAIGTIMTLGFSGGIAPPGVPSVGQGMTQGANFAIVNGRFLLVTARPMFVSVSPANGHRKQR